MIHNAGLESGARVTVSQENISDIPGLIDLCAEYRVGDFAFTRYAPNGGDKNSIAPYSTVMACRRTEGSILGNIFSDSIEELQQVKSCCRDINLYEG